MPPGSLVEVTCRTLQGRLFLRPDPQTDDICLGVLARAARLYPLEVHDFRFLSNHYHLLLSVPSAQRLSEFMNYLNSNVAREIGRAVGWREKFWGRRYQLVLVSEEEAAQVGRLLYLMRQGCKENLVRRPADWPGASALEALLTGAEIQGRWFDRTMEYEARRRRGAHEAPDSVRVETLRLAPLPCWRDLEPEVYRARISELARYVEEETQRLIETTGRPPVGRAALLRQDPHGLPTPLKRSAAPLVHAATRLVREALRKAYVEFASAYRTASRQLRLEPMGLELMGAFPEGCFPPSGPFVARRDSG